MLALSQCSLLEDVHAPVVELNHSVAKCLFLEIVNSDAVYIEDQGGCPDAIKSALRLHLSACRLADLAFLGEAAKDQPPLPLQNRMLGPQTSQRSCCI